MLASIEEGLAIIREIDADRRTAERYLLHYPELLKDYEAARRVAVDGEPVVDADKPPMMEPFPKDGKIENVGGGRSNLSGNPTEARALKAAAYDEKQDAYAWLKAVEIVQRSLGERKNIFIEIRREAEAQAMEARVQGRPGWVVYCQMHYQNAIAERFLDSARYVGERTIREWWGQLISRVAAVHARIK
jgi:rhodanese-related sulfurtransferase